MGGTAEEPSVYGDNFDEFLWIDDANLTGFPDLVVPAGFTGNGLPVGISFMGRAFSEPRLLALGYAFEQVTEVRRLPANTPVLPSETIGSC